MTMVKQVVVAMVLGALAVGCGGKGGSSTSENPGGGQVEPGADDNEASMVPPEKMEEITRLLDRKRTIVSRCLAFAVDNKDLPKNSRGKITLAITISPAGKAEDIKVVKATLESKSLEECVIGHVREIQFPELPKPYPTSYTYAFEAG
jgi:hypothetical protein